jgi:hypothetical protein
VSLILEALKKLERDKQVEGRTGFLVMAARPWPSAGENRRWIALGVAGGAFVMMALGAGLASWLWRSNARPSAASAPAPAPAASAALSVPPTAMPPASAPAAVVPASSAAAASAVSIPAAPKAAALPSTADLRPSVPRAPAADAAETTEPRAPLQVIPPAPSPVPAGAARFRLTAISEREGKPVAMLNERLVMEGDSFDDVTVVRITPPDEVELKVAGKPVVVRF